jgi:hypothetical protein
MIQHLAHLGGQISSEEKKLLDEVDLFIRYAVVGDDVSSVPRRKQTF